MKKKDLNNIFPNVQKNVPLSSFSTFGIGGKAKWFYQVKEEKNLIQLVKFCKENNIPYFVLGGGSNVLFSDDSFKGLVIKIDTSDYEIKGEKIIVKSGVSLSKLVDLAYKNSLSGLEFALSIPGTIGGAVVINASAAGHKMSEIIEKVKILTEEGEIKELSFVDNLFKDKKGIILEVVLRLKKQKKEKIKEEMQKALSLRKNQPTGKSAGCVFKNPLLLSAGKLIEECGLKGKKIGAAQISEKHANFIINLGSAKASDVLKLITYIKEKVKAKFNIDLKLEIVLVKNND